MGSSSGSVISLHLERKSIESTKTTVLRPETTATDDAANGRIANGSNVHFRNRSGRSLLTRGSVMDLNSRNNSKGAENSTSTTMGTPPPVPLLPPKGPAFASWSAEDAAEVARHHPVPCVFALSLLFFMGVEYTLRMVPFDSPPLDVGFVLTRPLHGFVAGRPALNSVLAALNTVFVGMQTAYILWTFLVEGRPRPGIAALFMFTCRGILGFSTQLPLPPDFLGSGMDFPVGNVSFFLFFSGHVAGAVIASLDMRRMRRRRMALAFDALNALQGLRLLVTRGHYTIDLAVGVGAGFIFDTFAGKYEKSKNHAGECQRRELACSGCSCR